MPSPPKPPSPGANETFFDVDPTGEAAAPLPSTQQSGAPGPSQTLAYTLDDGEAPAAPLPEPANTQPPDPFSTVDWQHGELPERIGKYRIIRQIGEGGMGVVYQAEQDRPRRTVALKVLRQALANVAMRRRFEFEAEVLARLDHPGIARILEAGVEGPRSFFAMEFVDGAPLDVHARKAKATVEDRCTLIAKIAEAVHHAHGRGVVHRDLKPGNVLVDSDGQPKVLDFGIARVADESGRSTGQHTRMGQVIGTPAYMSPEQTQGDSRKLDARSDVYALGVLAWELFSGKKLLDTDGIPIPELIRAIREDEAPWLTKVAPSVPRDVATIVAKALEKEPDRRYQSAMALADDLHRYQRDEPIAARPATATYQLRKFARRNRGLVAMGMLGLLGLLAGLTATTSQWLRARDAERDALSARDDALAAQERLSRRTDALTLMQARNLIERDPTRAVAYLKQLRDPAILDDAWAVGWQALGAGVASEVLEGHEGDVRALLWGPDRRFVVTGSYDNSVRFWDLESGEQRLFGRHDADIKALALLPNGAGVLAGDDAGEVRHYALDGSLKQAWHGLGDTETIAVSHDRVAVATEARVWGLRLGQLEPELLSDQPAQALAWWDDKLAMAGEDGVVRVHTAIGNLTWHGHEGPVEDVVIYEGQIVSAGADGTVRRWDGATSTVLFQQEHPLRDLAVGAGGLAAADRGGSLIFWDGEQAQRWRAHTGVVRWLDATDHWIASAGEDGHIGLWRPRDGLKRTLIGHEGRVRNVQWSDRAAGAQLLSGAADGTARIWRPDDMPLVRQQIGRSPLEGVAVRGRRLIYGDQDGRVWTQQAGAGVVTLVGEGAEEVTTVAWRGEQPAAGFRDGSVLRGAILPVTHAKIDVIEGGEDRFWIGDRAGGLYEVPAVGPARKLGGHEGRVRALAFGPGGLLSGAEDGRVLRWGEAGEAPIPIFERDAEVRALGWSGATPVACYDDGHCEGAPSGPAQVTTLSTSGARVAVGDNAGLVRGWPGTHIGAVTGIAWTAAYPVSVGLDGRVVLHSDPPRAIELGYGALKHVVAIPSTGELVVLGQGHTVWFLPTNLPTDLGELQADLAERSSAHLTEDDALVGRFAVPPKATRPAP